MKLGGWRPTAVILAAVSAGALLTALLLLVTREGPGRAVSGAAAATVLDHPDRFVGTTVRLQDRVKEVPSARSVTLGAGGLLVLNLAIAPAIDDVADGDRSLVGDVVQVTGEVRIFRMEEIEAEVGVLDEDRFRAFIGRPVVIARSIEPVNAGQAPYRSLLQPR